MVFLSQPNMTWLYSQVSDTLTISYHLVDASNRYQFNHLCLRSSPLYPQKMLGLNAPNIKLCPLKIIAVTSIKIETSKKNRKCHFQLGKTKNINSCSICFGSDIYIYIFIIKYIYIYYIHIYIPTKYTYTHIIPHHDNKNRNTLPAAGQCGRCVPARGPRGARQK